MKKKLNLVKLAKLENAKMSEVKGGYVFHKCKVDPETKYTQDFYRNHKW